MVVVRLETILGSHYRFPDVEKEVLQKFTILAKGAEPVITHGQLQLVNVSYAMLSVPIRIVKSIYIDDELWWESPSCAA